MQPVISDRLFQQVYSVCNLVEGQADVNPEAVATAVAAEFNERGVNGVLRLVDKIDLVNTADSNFEFALAGIATACVNHFTTERACRACRPMNSCR